MDELAQETRRGEEGGGGLLRCFGSLVLWKKRSFVCVDVSYSDR